MDSSWIKKPPWAVSTYLFCCGLILLFALSAPAAAFEVSVEGTVQDIRVNRQNLGYHQASARLRFDLDYTFQARILLGEPVIQCVVRVHNIRGQVETDYGGTWRQLDVNADNADLIRFNHIDLVLTKWMPSAQRASLFCDAGMPGQGERDAFNVGSSPNWDQLYCKRTRSPDIDRVERLRRETACRHFDPLPQHLDEDEAKTLFTDPARYEAGAIVGASFSVGALRFSVGDLLREALELEEREESPEDLLRSRLDNSMERLTREGAGQPSATESRATGEGGTNKSGGDPGTRLAERLNNRSGQSSDTASRQSPSDAGARLDAMLAGVTRDRRVADLERKAERHDALLAEHDQETERALSQCQRNKPRDPRWNSGPQLSLRAVYADEHKMTRAEREAARQRAERARERRQREERERMQARIRDYEHDLAIWERQRDQCLAQTEPKRDRERQQLIEVRARTLDEIRELTSDR